ncbi:MAG: hypothetical protein ACK4SR_09580 [Thiobacillus sp.]
MYIVAIGWAYVTLMMAITASSPGKALAIVLFLCILPLALFIYVFGRPPLRRSMPVTDETANQRDRGDT